MNDRELLALIPYKRFEHPSKIALKSGSKRINAQLGRLYRSSLVERVPGSTCFLYRSLQAVLA